MRNAVPISSQPERGVDATPPRESHADHRETNVHVAAFADETHVRRSTFASAETHVRRPAFIAETHARLPAFVADETNAHRSAFEDGVLGFERRRP